MASRVGSLTRPGTSTLTYQMYEDFESGNLNSTFSNGFTWDWDAGDVTVSSTQSYAGSYALRFGYPSGGDGWAEQRLTLGASAQPNLWVCYSLRVPDGWQHGTFNSQSNGDNNKFFAIWMDSYENTGPTGVIQTRNDGSGGANLYPYIRDRLNTHPGETNTGFTLMTPADAGRWMHIAIYCEMASNSSTADGKFEMYRRWDDESTWTQCFAFNAWDNYHVGGNQGWKQAYLLGWFNAVQPSPTVWYIDNFFTTLDDPTVTGSSPGWVASTTVYSAQSSVVITSVDTDNVFTSDQTNIVIAGSGFGVTEGTVKINGVTQAVTSWSDTSITLTNYVGYWGAHVVTVTDSSSNSGQSVVTVNVPSSYTDYITLDTGFGTGANYWTNADTGVIASGDQAAFPTGVTLLADGTAYTSTLATYSCLFNHGAGTDAFDLTFTAGVDLPTITTAEVVTSGDLLSVNFDRVVTAGADGFDDVTLTFSGGAITATYFGGDGTSTISYTLSRDVEEDETCTLDYTQPGDGIQDTSGGLVATVAGVVVTNSTNYPPTISGRTTIAATTDGGVSETYTFTGLDGTAPVLSGTDASSFTLEFTGTDEWTLKGENLTTGSYEVSISADDGVNAAVFHNITINVTENLKPVITLIGDPNVSLIQGQSYTDEGATAEDPEEGDITHRIKTVSNVDTTQPGNYTVTYNVKDTLGLAADEVVRNVSVTLPDTIPDQFELGADKTDAKPWETVVRSFVLQGIDQGVTLAVTATDDAEVSSTSDPSYGATCTAQLGDTVNVLIIASEHFSTPVTGGCDISGITDSITVTTLSSKEVWIDTDIGDSESFKDNEDFTS